MAREMWDSGFLILILGLTFAFSACSEIDNPIATRCRWKALFDGESLTGWKSTQFGGEGQVRVEGSAIVLSFGKDLTGITWQEDFPTYNYEISLEAQRVKGSDFFCGMTFPVGDSFCSFIVGGWAGPVVGISNVDGLDASENETSRLKKFENGRWYEVRVRVSSEKVKAWIDGEEYVDLSIEEHRLTVRPEVRLSRPFGIASWQTIAALRNIRIRYPVSNHE
jgi:hypothetical protein